MVFTNGNSTLESIFFSKIQLDADNLKYHSNAIALLINEFILRGEYIYPSLK